MGFILKGEREINGIKHVKKERYGSLRTIANHYEIMELDVHDSKGRLLERIGNTLNEQNGIVYTLTKE